MWLITRRSFRCIGALALVYMATLLSTRFLNIKKYVFAQKFLTAEAFLSVEPRFRIHTTTICRLNRFLFESTEIDSSDPSNPVVVLPIDDYRTVHAAKVLGIRNGDKIRSGVVSCLDHDGLITDDSTIEWIPCGKVKKAEPLGNGNPPGSLVVKLGNLQPASSIIPTPPVSLILALPRPLQLGRLLPMIAQMGVDSLILTEATKVPRDYFGSHLFRTPSKLTEKLVEGLCQSGDVRLPKIQIVRNLTNFLCNDLDMQFPKTQYSRVIAHPLRKNDEIEYRMRSVVFPENGNRKLVIAIGPEGGWTEPEELDLFRQNGFQQITLGARVLRTDCAVVSLLALSHDACL